MSIQWTINIANLMNAIGHIVNACYYMQESFDNKTEMDDKRIFDTVGHTVNACRTRIVCQNDN